MKTLGRILLLTMLGSSVAESAELRIRVVPPEGYTEPVVLKKAKLLMGWWGHTADVDLRSTVENSELVVSVPITDEVWRDLTNITYGPDFAFIYLEFQDFVPVRSDSFEWRAPSVPNAPITEERSADQFTIKLPGAESATFAANETFELNLPVRLPSAAPKQLRFIDDAGQPVTDIKVSGGMFWSNSNHCGVVAGYERYFENATPAADGTLVVPDADVEYAFGLDLDGRGLIVDPKPDYYGDTLMTHIESSPLVVRIHRFPRPSFKMHVTQDGKSVAGVQVTATVARACGAASGLLGTTDADGLIQIDDFAPERFEAICINDQAGQMLWSSAPSPDGQMSVDLPATATTGKSGMCYLPRQR